MSRESFQDRFSDRTSARGDDIAISFLRNGLMETELSYGALHRDTARMANFLLDRGLGKDDRAILFLPKSLVFVIAHLACQRIGAISVPLNPGFTRTEMTYLMEDAGAKVVIAGTQQAALIREINPGTTLVEVSTDTPYQDLSFFRSFSDRFAEGDIASNDPGLIIYTSGTTGKPKGAVLTQKNLIHDAENIIRIWDITDRDVLCHALPLFHVHGLCFALHTALLAGSHVVMMDGFYADPVIELLAKGQSRYRCTVFMAVPAMYQKLIAAVADRPLDFSDVRLWASGSAPMLPKDFETIEHLFGKAPVEREGMSETGMNFSNPLRGERKPGSIGLPLPGLQVRIVNPDTLEEGVAGKTGELWLKGASITPGYWGNPEATEATFVNGWFRTGDLGHVDGDGYYYLTDRIKHIIISGGENISPKEVASVINRCEDVSESAVV
ncbi:MAG: class I adenylate-forming enzyme family protein, partial [Desulfobacterales bacterium]